MTSLWNDQEAQTYKGELGLRVYTSRLLGRDKSLVLHGGGNTSVKILEKNIVGEEEEILYVKGSGWDLETIAEAGFSPVKMDYLLKLSRLESLSDPQMVNELRTHMTLASAPTPSVETILHAILPYKYVDHTHADALVSVTNTPAGRQNLEEIYGDDVVIIPYLMPGYDLAKYCAQNFAKLATGKTIGMALMNHGMFSFGSTAKESYERMIELIERAEKFLQKKNAWSVPAAAVAPKPIDRQARAALRLEISREAGAPFLLRSYSNDKTLAFASRADLQQVSQQGPATPDHVIRTKRLPLLGKDVKAYAEAYQQYFATHSAQAREPKKILDRAPRVVLDPDFGLATAGRTAKDCAIVAEIYDHTIDIISRSAALGQYQALPAKDIFDVEYWDLEQAKLKKDSKAPAFSGEVALVTGAASGIGKATVDSLLARGAAVVALDINPAVTSLYQRADYLGIACDLTNEEQISSALDQAVASFGGVDMLILNAGIFPASKKIAEMKTADWQKVMSINLDSNLVLLRESHALLRLAPGKGRVVIIGSKNVPAPGPGAAAYSASKAALNQLARVAAMEWGADGIRINSIHPNAVFDTGIWTEEVLAARAKHYGLSVQEYKTNNVMKVEVSSRDVAELAAEMCGPLFAKTTAAQVPVDGGNDRVI